MSAAVKVCVGYVVGGEPLNLPDGEYQLSAIAPPVAAGSVDTPEFSTISSECGKTGDDYIRLLAHINAWAAQHVANAIKDQKERAEKAEADLVQVNEWRAAALASNQQMQELMTAKLAAAEARAKELEAALAKAYPSAINPSDTPC